MARAKKPAIEVLDRIDLHEDFSDVDGDLTNEFALRPDEADSDKHFVWVHNDPEAVREYRDHVLHYEPVTVKGEIPTRRDHVLMACDEGRWRKRQRYEKVRDLKERAALTREAQKSLQPYQIGD
jgi:hypothetical protein